MRNVFRIAAMAAIISMAAGCGEIIGDDIRDNVYKPLELSTKSREFVQQGHGFAFDYISRINAEAETDYIVSPLSMQFLLGMILDGAQGETAAEICNVLGYGAGETAAVNEYCLSMLKQLPNIDRKTKLSIANAIFVDDGWPLLDSYEADVAKYYQAEVSNLDFTDNAGSLKEINGWAKKQTNGMIDKVLDKVNPDMLAYLLNALYFKSQWAEKFDKGDTEEEDFTNEAGKQLKVKMMKQTCSLDCDENDIFKMVRMPYGNGAFSMYAFLPQKGYKVSDVCAELKKIDWDSFRYSAPRCEVNLWLPKFETKYHIKLNDILKAMGMPLAFDKDRANFKAMSMYALCLDFVQQDAIIKIDEEGTEAAAVSVGGMMKDTAFYPGENVDFHADRPFLYLISETSTGAILFAGRYSGE